MSTTPHRFPLDREEGRLIVLHQMDASSVRGRTEAVEPWDKTGLAQVIAATIVFVELQAWASDPSNPSANPMTPSPAGLGGSSSNDKRPMVIRCCCNYRRMLERWPKLLRT